MASKQLADAATVDSTAGELPKAMGSQVACRRRAAAAAAAAAVLAKWESQTPAQMNGVPATAPSTPPPPPCPRAARAGARGGRAKSDNAGTCRWQVSSFSRTYLVPSPAPPRPAPPRCFCKQDQRQRLPPGAHRAVGRDSGRQHKLLQNPPPRRLWRVSHIGGASGRVQLAPTARPTRLVAPPRPGRPACATPGRTPRIAAGGAAGAERAARAAKRTAHSLSALVSESLPSRRAPFRATAGRLGWPWAGPKGPTRSKPGLPCGLIPHSR